jgi:hypothetical protein
LGTLVPRVVHPASPSEIATIPAVSVGKYRRRAFTFDAITTNMLSRR